VVFTQALRQTRRSRPRSPVLPTSKSGLQEPYGDFPSPAAPRKVQQEVGRSHRLRKLSDEPAGMPYFCPAPQERPGCSHQLGRFEDYSAERRAAGSPLLRPAPRALPV